MLRLLIWTDEDPLSSLFRDLGVVISRDSRSVGPLIWRTIVADPRKESVGILASSTQNY